MRKKKVARSKVIPVLIESLEFIRILHFVNLLIDFIAFQPVQAETAEKSVNFSCIGDEGENGQCHVVRWEHEE